MPERSILLIQCPSCEHTNSPGERFCAKCGVPLHLKPCPACGKVHDADAASCSVCKAAFPVLAAEQYVMKDLDRPIEVARQRPESTAIPVMPDDSLKPTPANRAWPLIVVALVAGGIPFLWMFRSNMPLPKAWQTDGQRAVGGPVAAPVAVPVAVPVAPAVLAAPAAAPVAPNVNPVSVPASTVGEVVVPAKSDAGKAPANDAVPTTPTVGPATAVTDKRQVSKPRPPQRKAPPTNARPPARHPINAAGAAAEPAVPSRPCTEALSALDLCAPKPSTK